MQIKKNCGMYAMYISHEEIELEAYLDFMQSLRYTKKKSFWIT